MGGSSLKAGYCDEPAIILGGGERAIDPKYGLMAYGPNGLRKDHLTVRIGAVGTPEGLASLRHFLRNIEDAIAPPKREGEAAWLVPFPGLRPQGPLGFHFELDPDSTERIRPEEEAAALAPTSKKDKVAALFRLYEEKLQDFAMSAHADARLVLLPLSRRLFDECQTNGRIYYERRVFGDFPNGANVPLFDFHHAMKAIAAGHGLACQMMKPDTLGLKTRQDAATTAWNLSSALYYKATANPWKLAELDQDTCLVGITFFNEITPEGGFLRASMAHVYMKEGESQVIRGARVADARDLDSAHVHFTAEQSETLLANVIRVFERQHGRLPGRIVVHKRAPYGPDEIDGFARAAERIASHDLVHIQSEGGPRFFVRGQNYPPPRGSYVASNDERKAFLYTTGFIPALQTYPGSTVPEPLFLNHVVGDTPLQTILDDVLALTKLDWNSTDFCIREPVTLGVSEKVGGILAETASRLREPPPQYRYYM